MLAIHSAYLPNGMCLVPLSTCGPSLSQALWLITLDAIVAMGCSMSVRL
jgi:hypothetical protein